MCKSMLPDLSFSRKGVGDLLTGNFGPNKKLPDIVKDPSGLLIQQEGPKLETVNPADEQAKAENNAAAAANAKAAQRRRASKNSSLLATGGQGVTQPAQTQSVLAYGKEKLGQ